MSKSNTKKGKAANRKTFWVRVMCIVLCALLVGGTITSVLYMLIWQ